MSETKTKPVDLQDLIDILALPNMGDEGRKAKLVAIKEWQIKFLNQTEQAISNYEKLANIKNINLGCAKCAHKLSSCDKANVSGKASVLRDVLKYEP